MLLPDANNSMVGRSFTKDWSKEKATFLPRLALNYFQCNTYG